MPFFLIITSNYQAVRLVDNYEELNIPKEPTDIIAIIKLESDVVNELRLWDSSLEIEDEY